MKVNNYSFNPAVDHPEKYNPLYDEQREEAIREYIEDEIDWWFDNRDHYSAEKIINLMNWLDYLGIYLQDLTASIDGTEMSVEAALIYCAVFGVPVDRVLLAIKGAIRQNLKMRAKASRMLDTEEEV